MYIKLHFYYYLLHIIYLCIIQISFHVDSYFPRTLLPDFTIKLYIRSSDRINSAYLSLKSPKGLSQPLLRYLFCIKYNKSLSTKECRWHNPSFYVLTLLKLFIKVHSIKYVSWLQKGQKKKKSFRETSMKTGYVLRTYVIECFAVP